MSLTAVSLAWAFLQITVLCGVSLTLAWALRGRRPQFASALLTGACVASVFLALVATMPLCQWTFAIPEQIAKTESSLITNSLPKISTSSKSNSIDISTQNPQSMDEPVEGSSDRCNNKQCRRQKWSDAYTSRDNANNAQSIWPNAGCDFLPWKDRSL
jgi:hypothetical protein